MGFIEFMGVSAVSSEIVINSNRPESFLHRVSRGFTIIGWLALIVGGALGFMQTDPDIVLSRLPVSATAGAVTIVATAILGLACGAIIGLWLWGSTGTLRFLLSLMAILISVISTELMRGLLLELNLRESFTSYSDLLEGVQIVVGALGALLGIRTGRAPQDEVVDLGLGAEPGIPAQPPRRQRSSRASTPREAPPARRERRQSRRSSTTGQLAPASASPVAPNTPSVQLRRPTPASSPSRPRRKKLGRGRRVHLGRQVSSVCPYCLEEVLPNDPRGRVVCRICHTPHHGDCWAITGKCEVPHLQT